MSYLVDYLPGPLGIKVTYPEGISTCPRDKKALFLSSDTCKYHIHVASVYTCMPLVGFYTSWEFTLKGVRAG